MADRSAKFALAMFAGLLAIAPITIMTFGFAHAAGHCQTKPGSEARRGQHWYYRIEHGTGRHCWYLGEEGERTATSSAGGISASQANEIAMKRSIADARDELPPPGVRMQQDGGASTARRPRTDVPTAASPAGDQNPGASAGPADGVLRSLVASRWPEPMVEKANPAPEASATRVADLSPTPQTEPSLTSAPETLAAAPAQQAAGSLQMLLLLILGAVALASLIEELIEEFTVRRSKPSRSAMESMLSR